MPFSKEQMKELLNRAEPGSKWHTWTNRTVTLIGSVPNVQRMLIGAHYVLMDASGRILLVDEYGRDMKWTSHIVAAAHVTSHRLAHPFHSDDVGSGP